MLTLKGTPFLYNGEEIGMSDLMLEEIEQFRDNLGVWIYRETTENFGVSPEAALGIVQNITRDKCRTPMQWENTPNGGFSPDTVQTWLPVNPNYSAGVNVADQLGDPGSILNFYKQVLAVRKNTPVLIDGDYQPLHQDQEAYFAFLRSTPGGPSPKGRCLVVLNYAAEPQTAAFNLNGTDARLIFSSVERPDRINLERLEIGPFEILIAEL